MLLPELVAHWRAHASELRAFGAEPQAVTLERAALELEGALREQDDADLTLEQARRESGYSDRQLRAKLADGSIPNAGRRFAPRIKRSDLPKKRPAKATPSAYDPERDAAALLSRRA